MKSDHKEQLVQNLAKEAGVSSEDAQKVLSALGLDALLANVEDVAGTDRIAKIKPGDLKVAARMGRSSITV